MHSLVINSFVCNGENRTNMNRSLFLVHERSLRNKQIDSDTRKPELSNVAFSIVTTVLIFQTCFLRSILPIILSHSWRGSGSISCLLNTCPPRSQCIMSQEVSESDLLTFPSFLVVTNVHRVTMTCTSLQKVSFFFSLEASKFNLHLLGFLLTRKYRRGLYLIYEGPVKACQRS